MLYRQFYSELGKLLYAIADIDGMISAKEKKKLKEVVSKELAPSEIHRDEFGTDAAYYAEFEFEILEEARYEPEVAFESFLNFIENHKTAIDENMIWATHRVAAKLAEAYYHTNKKEKQMIDRLNKKLEALLAEKNRLYQEQH